MVRGHDYEVGVMDVDSGAPPVELTRGATAILVRWSESGEELLVSGTWGKDRRSLRWVSPSDGSSRPFEPVLDLGPAETEGGSFSLDATGRFIAYVAIEKTGDVWLTETARARR
jgi:hypothetical protein